MGSFLTDGIGLNLFGFEGVREFGNQASQREADFLLHSDLRFENRRYYRCQFRAVKSCYLEASFRAVIWKRGRVGLSGDQMDCYSWVLSFFLILRILPRVFRRVVEKSNCGGTCRPLAVWKCFGRRDFVGYSSVAVAEVIDRSKVVPFSEVFCILFSPAKREFMLFLFRILENRALLTPCLVVEESATAPMYVGVLKNVFIRLNPSFLVNICLFLLSISDD